MKGHWKKGRRRNPTPPAGLVCGLRSYYLGRLSLRSIAADCGVCPKTVRFWLSGKWHPSKAKQRKIAKMIEGRLTQPVRVTAKPK